MLNSNISSTCSHNTADFDQRVSRLGFVTAAMSLTGGQPHSARCLAVSCAGTLFIHFRGLLPPDKSLLAEFWPVQNSLYVQVLRSPILETLLHGTPAVSVSQTLRRGTRNGITELSQTAPPIFGIGPHSSHYETQSLLIVSTAYWHQNLFSYNWSSSSVCLIMVALWNRSDHYIFIL